MMPAMLFTGILAVALLPLQTKDLAVIPLPAKVQQTGQGFALRQTTRLVYQKGNTGAQLAASAFGKEAQAATGFSPVVSADDGKRPAIVWTSSGADANLGAEGYSIRVLPNKVIVAAPTAKGLFYGSQTLAQMVENNAGGWQIPGVEIWDKPTFGWRGFMLDTCRHFRSVPFIKKNLDRMARLKLNVFHWHLTDDQGWRIEIKKYPKLTQIGAWRESPSGPYGGFYTQNEIKDVVAYAAKKHITVVPEIEMPGHAVAALASYPELSCTGGPFKVETRWGVFPDIFCAGKDETFVFLKNVLDEVLTLFPSKFIHIGGDEAPKDRWKQCPDCQKRIADQGLKDEHELQSWFVKQMDAYLDSKGRRLIGWDEILEGGLAPGAAVQSWRGMGGAVAAASEGHDVVASPTSHCYLDYGYNSISLRKAYSFDPVPESLTPEQRKHILGLSGNMWAEHTPTDADIDRQAYPRLVALAEAAWTPAARKNYESFKNRLRDHRFWKDLVGGAIEEEGTEVGAWSPNQVTTDWTALELDVTKFVQSAGVYRFQFRYEAGAHGLDTKDVALRSSDADLATDSHEGFAGANSTRNTYTLRVATAPTGKVTLVAQIKGSGGNDSNGHVVLLAPRREPR